MYYLTCANGDNSDTQNIVIRDDSGDVSDDIRLATIGTFRAEESVKYVQECLERGDIDFLRYILDHTNFNEILHDLGVSYGNELK